MQLPRCRQLQRVQVRNERLTACVRISRSGSRRACIPGQGRATLWQRQFPAGKGPIADPLASLAGEASMQSCALCFIRNFAYNKDRGSHGGFCSLC